MHLEHPEVDVAIHREKGVVPGLGLHSEAILQEQQQTAVGADVLRQHALREEITHPIAGLAQHGVEGRVRLRVHLRLQGKLPDGVAEAHAVLEEALSHGVRDSHLLLEEADDGTGDERTWHASHTGLHRCGHNGSDITVQPGGGPHAVCVGASAEPLHGNGVELGEVV